MRWRRFFGGEVAPDGFSGALDPDERMLACADTQAGPLVATTLGLWPPGEPAVRLGWHLISKVRWSDGALVVVVTDETGRAGDAVLIADREPVRFALVRPGKLPKVVRERVDGSIRSRAHKDLPGGGVWFAQRRYPDGAVVLQARPESGADLGLVRDLAAEAAARIAHAE